MVFVLVELSGFGLLVRRTVWSEVDFFMLRNVFQLFACLKHLVSGKGIVELHHQRIGNVSVGRRFPFGRDTVGRFYYHVPF